MLLHQPTALPTQFRRSFSPGIQILLMQQHHAKGVTGTSSANCNDIVAAAEGPASSTRRPVSPRQRTVHENVHAVERVRTWLRAASEQMRKSGSARRWAKLCCLSCPVGMQVIRIRILWMCLGSAQHGVMFFAIVSMSTQQGEKSGSAKASCGE